MTKDYCIHNTNPNVANEDSACEHSFSDSDGAVDEYEGLAMEVHSMLNWPRNAQRMVYT